MVYTIEFYDDYDHQWTNKERCQLLTIMAMVILGCLLSIHIQSPLPFVLSTLPAGAMWFVCDAFIN